ncbi:surfeit locus protein 2 [Actinidia rufa]|uniref:Surfeit locus protein 2 n=1 Tax=Actinidia rufa TaxID=165716 RepID=A0A7J0E9M5_9ERIC|nr:surfeit locus protein 2 [Actinidia rufa]
MGKKGVKEEEAKEKEGQNLLGQPSFRKLENGRFKCVETGHEVPAHAKDSYANTKHCRLGLIDAALARNQPPLNMFRPDPLSSSKLICKLTGDTVNKSEEHIWKHINGRRFLNMLEKKEAEKETPNGVVTEGEKKPEKKSKPKADSLKKKKKKQEKNVHKVISEVRNPSDKDSDSEEAEFWMPPAGERWDLDDGGDRWGSGSESGSETEDANDACATTEDGKDDEKELSKRTKRMSIEIGPSDYASRKKKKKTKPT